MTSSYHPLDPNDREHVTARLVEDLKLAVALGITVDLDPDGVFVCNPDDEVITEFGVTLQVSQLVGFDGEHSVLAAN